jgi:hypothetical protein
MLAHVECKAVVPAICNVRCMLTSAVADKPQLLLLLLPLQQVAL